MGELLGTGSGFRPVGAPEQVFANNWFGVEKQPMDFINPATGDLRASGEMNYVRMLPGVSIVAEVDGNRTLLLPQERYATNLVYGKSVWHYEVPAGGIEAVDTGHNVEIDESSVINAAVREFGEEAGFGADDYIILGPQRGAMSHPGVMTHSNLTVLARGVRPTQGGPLHEATELLGRRELFTWGQTEDMYMNPNGLVLPDGEHRIISSAATIASLNIARTWLERQSVLAPRVIDLGSHR